MEFGRVPSLFNFSVGFFFYYCCCCCFDVDWSHSAPQILRYFLLVSLVRIIKGGLSKSANFAFQHLAVTGTVSFPFRA